MQPADKNGWDRVAYYQSYAQLSRNKSQPSLLCCNVAATDCQGHFFICTSVKARGPEKKDGRACMQEVYILWSLFSWSHAVK